MFSVKSVIAAFILSSTAIAASADEIVIDTNDLHDTIGAELALSMQEMQQQLTEDTDAILIAEYQEETTADNVELTE